LVKVAKWDWAIVRDLGSGGQGKTSLVRRRGDPPDTITELLQHLKILITDSSSNAEFIRQQRERLPDTLHSIISKSDYGLFVQKRLLDPDQESIERLALEARVYRTINDPHLLRIIDQDEKWIVTEYQPNGTLESRLEGFRGHSIKTLKTIRPIVGVISKMHAEGFVHRDFKPANISLGLRTSWYSVMLASLSN